MDKPFQTRSKKKLCRQESGGGSPTYRAVSNAGKQCMTQKSFTQTKGNLGTGMSIQILLTATSVS